MEYPLYLPAAGQAGTVYLMGFVDSMELIVTHKAHARSETFKIVYQCVIKVR